MNELIALGLLGGLLTLDETSLGQFMVSRPLVAGTLTGWLLGAPLTGFAVGTLLEVYLLVQFPVGGSRFPEGAPAAVVAVATAHAVPLPGGEALGFALGLVWGQVGGLSVTALRSVNTKLALDRRGAGVSPGAVARVHLLGLTLDLLRGVGLTVVGVLVGRLLVSRWATSWPLDGPDTRGVLLLGGLVSVGILLSSFGGWRKRARLVSVGVMAGLAMGWLL